MADFAHWATACETAVWSPGTFMPAYTGNRAQTMDSVIEADPVASTLRAWMADQAEWSGTASDLLTCLCAQASDAVTNGKTWPSTPRALSGRLRRVATFLRTVGIHIDFDQKMGRRGRAKLSWKLKRLQALWCDDVNTTDITPREKGAEMSSVLRPVRKRKKGRTLGRVDIMRREDYAELELDAKVELIRSLVPLGLMQVEELLDAEVTALAGEHYARKAASIGGRRHGSNPGTVSLAGQRVPIRVPRVRSVAGSELPLRSYEALRGEGAVNALLLKRVLYGISCRNYEAAAEAIPGAIGLSGSTVSRSFIEASAAKLRALQERDLAAEDVVAVVLDGKTFAEATMVIALGITLSGEKRFLGFVETDTENERVLTLFLRSLVERGVKPILS